MSRFVISAGGTGGHIYPALSVAASLIADGHEVYFATSFKESDRALVQNSGLQIQELKSFKVAGFDRARPLTAASSSFKILKSYWPAKWWLQSIWPAAVACFGGYATLPVGLAADALGISLLVHEQNSYVGVANRLLSSRAQAVALGFAEASDTLKLRKGARLEVTGNPVRPEFMGSGARQSILNLLVFGGSQGAASINQVVFDSALSILREFPQLHITHLTGQGTFAEWSARYSQALDSLTSDDERKLYSSQYNLIAYSADMSRLLQDASLALCRSGASTLAELAATATPAILVPLPHATADHQNLNAQSFVDRGAALKIADADLSTASLLPALHQILDHESILPDMSQQMNLQFQQQGQSAAVDIVGLLYEIAAII